MLYELLASLLYPAWKALFIVKYQNIFKESIYFSVITVQLSLYWKTKWKVLVRENFYIYVVKRLRFYISINYWNQYF